MYAEKMVERLLAWCQFPSHSQDLKGLEEMAGALREAFAPLGGEERLIELPTQKVMTLSGELEEMRFGKVLAFTKRPTAPLQIYLGGHYDTVHQVAWEPRREGNRLFGPGVADMKGGLVILLEVLEILEEAGGKLGWTVLLNADEELGSIASAPLIRETARHCHLGLLFEPTLPSGELVSERKGSFNGMIVAKGKAAHVGRDPGVGRSAIVALADCIAHLPKKPAFNVGQIVGGSAPNVVAEQACASLSIRYEKPFRRDLEHHLEKIAKKHDVTLTLHPLSDRPPKPISKGVKRLIGTLQAQDSSIRWQKTGGVCDGNLVAAEGVPCLDTLGVQGGHLHTAREYCELDSLVRQVELSASLLLRLNSGDLEWENSDEIN